MGFHITDNFLLLSALLPLPLFVLVIIFPTACRVNCTISSTSKFLFRGLYNTEERWDCEFPQVCDFSHFEEFLSLSIILGRGILAFASIRHRI
ncbi:hypothetical protein ES705_50667 [subsurface metagenome]